MINSVTSSTSALYKLYLEQQQKATNSKTSDSESDFSEYLSETSETGSVPPPLPVNDIMSMMQNDSSFSGFSEDSQSSSFSDLMSIDSDSSNTLSENEYSSLLSELGISSEDAIAFSDIDTDSDGEITVDEIKSTMAEKLESMSPPPMPPQADVLGSSATESESESDSDLISNIYSSMDTNQDGVVSESEFSNYMESIKSAYESNFLYSADEENNSSYESAV